MPPSDDIPSSKSIAIISIPGSSGSYVEKKPAGVGGGQNLTASIFGGSKIIPGLFSLGAFSLNAPAVETNQPRFGGATYQVHEQARLRKREDRTGTNQTIDNFFLRRLEDFSEWASSAISSLNGDVAQLKKDVSRLKFAHSEGATLPSYSRSPVAEVKLAGDPASVLGPTVSGDAWVDVLEAIAEGELPPKIRYSRYAIEGLSSDDAAIRSASARALAALDPDEAARRLPPFIKDEENKYVIAAVNSALETAKLDIG